jgi:hypothetical protein
MVNGTAKEIPIGLNPHRQAISEYATATPLSSGSEQTQWYLSIHRQEQATPFGKDYGYERKGFNLNMVHHSADQKFSISPTIYYTLQDNNLIERDLSTQIILSPNAPALYTNTGAVNWEITPLTIPFLN